MIPNHDKIGEMVKEHLIRLIAPPIPLSRLQHVRDSIIENRNGLIKAQLDERFLQRQILKPVVGTKSDLEIALGNIQSRIKKTEVTLEFLAEMEKEYENDPADEAVS